MDRLLVARGDDQGGAGDGTRSTQAGDRKVGSKSNTRDREIHVMGSSQGGLGRRKALQNLTLVHFKTGFPSEVGALRNRGAAVCCSSRAKEQPWWIAKSAMTHP